MRVRLPRLLRPFGIVALMAAVPLLLGHGARAQSTAQFVPEPVYPSWNLVGFYPQAGDVNGAVYTWRPGDQAYEKPTSSLGPGAAYWANYGDSGNYYLATTGDLSASLTLAAGECAMVGNPSRTGSAKVRGATNVQVYSFADQTYFQSSLLGVGRGAWACNYGNVQSTVTINDDGTNVLNPTWPDCCAPTNISNGGMARVVIQNDSPYRLIFDLKQMDASGKPMSPTGDTPNGLYGDNDPCSTCPAQYTNHTICSPSAPTQSENLPPGNYVLHMQFDGPDLPDLIAPSIALQANTRYALCYFNGGGG